MELNRQIVKKEKSRWLNCMELIKQIMTFVMGHNYREGNMYVNKIVSSIISIQEYFVDGILPQVLFQQNSSSLVLLFLIIGFFSTCSSIALFYLPLVFFVYFFFLIGRA